MRKSFPTDRDEKRKALLDAVESVRDVLINCAEEAERIETLPQMAVDALYQEGLFSLKLPVVLGGAEADPVTQIEVIEAVSRIDASSGWCVMIGATGIARPGAFLPDKAIEQMFANGTIPRAATVGTPEGTAVLADGGYIINGTWRFASGIRHSQWTGGGVQHTRDDGSVEHLTAVFPTSQARIHDNWHVAGLKGTGSCDFSVSDLFVPEEFTWKRDCNVPRRGGNLYRMGTPGFVINEHVGFALGVGRRALDAITDTAQSKRRGRSPSLIANRGSFQQALGECDLKLRAARTLAMDIYEEAWQTVCETGELDPRIQAEMRSCATYATDTALEVVTRAFRYGGGSALHLSNILQRCLRDINAAAQHFMVNDSSYEDHAKQLMGMGGRLETDI